MQSSTEQPRYWMWTRRRLDGRPRIPSLTGVAAHDDSWEERAFAVDSSGRLGGCVWPPRCYSCSFCRREFRSAQALGGHMNVHRRDRARLKQSSPQASNLPDDDYFTSNGSHLHPQRRQLYTSLCSPIKGCSPNPSHDGVASASPLSPCKFWPVVAPTQENCTNLASSSCFSFTNQSHHHLKRSFHHTYARVPAEPELNSRIGDVCRSKIREEKSEKMEDNTFRDYCKRQRSIDVAPSFLGQGLDQGGRLHHHLRSDVLVVDHVTVEELDLELRLGDRPKIC